MNIFRFIFRLREQFVIFLTHKLDQLLYKFDLIIGQTPNIKRIHHKILYFSYLSRLEG